MRDRLFDTAETARTSAGHCRRATVKLDEFTRRWPASVADRLPGNLTVAEEKLTAADTAFDAELWQTVTDQGWVALHVGEDSGGLGLGLVELAVVAEETSRACLPGPFLATIWAATLLAEINDSARTAP